MKNGITKGQGNSQYWKTTAGASATYPDHQSFMQALEDGTFMMEQNGINPTGWVQQGTPLDKAHLLSDATATALGLSGDPSVDDALKAVGENTHKIGDILTTIRADLGDEWLLCNGATISLASYPKFKENAQIKTPSVSAKTAWTNIAITQPQSFIYANGYYCYVSCSGTAGTNIIVYYTKNLSGQWASTVVHSIPSNSTYYYGASVYAIRYVNGRFMVCGQTRQNKSGGFQDYRYGMIWYSATSQPSSNWTLWQINSLAECRDIAYNGTYYAIAGKQFGMYSSNSAYNQNTSAMVVYSNSLSQTPTTSLTVGTGESQPYSRAYSIIWDGSRFVVTLVDNTGGTATKAQVYWTSNITSTSGWNSITIWSGSNNSTFAIPAVIVYDGTNYIVGGKRTSNGPVYACVARASALSGGWTTINLWDFSGGSNNLTYQGTDSIGGVQSLAISDEGAILAAGVSSTELNVASSGDGGVTWRVSTIPLNTEVSSSGVYTSLAISGDKLIASTQAKTVFTDRNAFALPSISTPEAYNYIKVK